MTEESVLESYVMSRITTHFTYDAENAVLTVHTAPLNNLADIDVSYQLALLAVGYDSELPRLQSYKPMSRHYPSYFYPENQQSSKLFQVSGAGDISEFLHRVSEEYPQLINAYTFTKKIMASEAEHIRADTYDARELVATA